MCGRCGVDNDSLIIWGIIKGVSPLIKIIRAGKRRKNPPLYLPPFSKGGEGRGIDRLIRKSNFFHFRRKMLKYKKLYRREMMDSETVNRSVRSWEAHAVWGDTFGLRRKLFKELGLYEKQEFSGIRE